MISWIHQQASQLKESYLIHQAKQGNHQAFGQLYVRYLDSIYRYMYYRVNQHHPTAEDLTQTVFYKALCNLAKYQQTNGNGNFKAWLYRIAHNTVIDHYRTSATNLPLHDIDFQLGTPTNPTTLDLDQVTSALKFLTQDQQAVIVLHCIEGFDYNEISHMLHKPEPAIRALQSRAIKKLKKIINI